MTSEAHDHHGDMPSDLASFAHRGRHLLLPLAAIASGLTAAHDQGLAFSIGAVAAWLLWLFTLFLADLHDWRACSYCDRPSRIEATPAARAKLARRRHSKIVREAVALLFAVVMGHAVFPKPYMGPWWMKVIAGTVYFLAAVVFGSLVLRSSLHDRYHDECHVEWCRAGMKRKPGLTWKRRRLMRSAHYGVWMIAVLAPTACALGLFTSSHPHFWLHIVYGLLLVFMTVTVLEISVGHTSEPCLYCARHLPDNPEEAAEKRMFWLRLFHRTRVVVLMIAGVSWVTSWVLAGTVGAKVLVCAAALDVLFWAVLERVHSPVKPWCPLCKDDGGEDAAAGVPDPSTNAPTPA